MTRRVFKNLETPSEQKIKKTKKYLFQLFTFSNDVISGPRLLGPVS
jgi:hypothetical protein